MKKNKKILLVISAVLLLCTMLCGCVRKVKVGTGKFPVDTGFIKTVITEEDLPKLDTFRELRGLDVSGSRCMDAIIAWAQEHPYVKVDFSLFFPDGTEAVNTDQELDISGLSPDDTDRALELLAYMTELRDIKLCSGLSIEQLCSFFDACPGARFHGGFEFDGKECNLDAPSLDLSGMSSGEGPEILKCLPYMNSLKSIELGNDARADAPGWDLILAVHEACPEAELRYDFTLYGKPFSLSDKKMDLNHIEIKDDGRLVAKITKCMSGLEYLDMDSCGVSNESMAAIRDALPDTEVVWRIWFADAYSVRTDVERILASNPGLGGDIIGDNADSLKYCTKVKYLDIGHNDYMTDISFVSHMPDLEVLIIALSQVSDLRPLADCPKLEYLEIQLTAVNDLRPLSGLKNLRHINIGYCYALRDLSPLFELPDLERVWIGQFVPVPPEQIEQLKKSAPHCEVNTSKVEYENWRYTGMWVYGAPELTPRYDLLRQQMRYGEAPYSYAYYWNDPLY